jgi:hypothetical protein
MIWAEIAGDLYVLFDADDYGWDEPVSETLVLVVPEAPSGGGSECRVDVSAVGFCATGDAAALKSVGGVEGITSNSIDNGFGIRLRMAPLDISTDAPTMPPTTALLSSRP